MNDWPPDWPGPIPVSDAEDAKVTRLRRELHDAISVQMERREFIDQCRMAAWIAWHDRNGWPAGEDDYPNRLRAATSAEALSAAKAVLNKEKA